MSTPSNHGQIEMTKLMKNGFKVETIGDGTRKFYVQFLGPKTSFYKGGVWRVKVKLPDDYPFKPPAIKFDNPIYHPNIDEGSGLVCMDVLDEAWDSKNDLVRVFELFLPQLLVIPNPDSPQNVIAAILMKNDPKAYKQKVEDYCERYAKSEDAGFESEEKSGDEELTEDDKHVPSEEENAGNADPKHTSTDEENGGEADPKHTSTDEENAGEADPKQTSSDEENAGEADSKHTSGDEENAGEADPKQTSSHEENAGEADSKHASSDEENADKADS